MGRSMRCVALFQAEESFLNGLDTVTPMDDGSVTLVRLVRFETPDPAQVVARLISI